MKIGILCLLKKINKSSKFWQQIARIVSDYHVLSRLPSPPTHLYNLSGPWGLFFLWDFENPGLRERQLVPEGPTWEYCSGLVQRFAQKEKYRILGEGIARKLHFVFWGFFGGGIGWEWGWEGCEKRPVWGKEIKSSPESSKGNRQVKAREKNIPNLWSTLKKRAIHKSPTAGLKHIIPGMIEVQWNWRVDSERKWWDLSKDQIVNHLGTVCGFTLYSVKKPWRFSQGNNIIWYLFHWMLWLLWGRKDGWGGARTVRVRAVRSILI